MKTISQLTKEIEKIRRDLARIERDIEILRGKESDPHIRTIGGEWWE